MTVGREKLVELAYCRKFAGARRGLEASLHEQRKKGANIARFGVKRRFAQFFKAAVIVHEVAGVGVKGVFCRALLGGEHIEKGFDEAGYRPHELPPYLLSRAGGMT